MKTIQLTPSCKDYLWGGEKLRTEYGIPLHVIYIVPDAGQQSMAIS